VDSQVFPNDPFEAIPPDRVARLAGNHDSETCPRLSLGGLAQNDLAPAAMPAGPFAQRFQEVAAAAQAVLARKGAVISNRADQGLNPRRRRLVCDGLWPGAV
jgi:hypothetical protein